jgi:hypothetical protein
MPRKSKNKYPTPIDDNWSNHQLKQKLYGAGHKQRGGGPTPMPKEWYNPSINLSGGGGLNNYVTKKALDKDFYVNLKGLDRLNSITNSWNTLHPNERSTYSGDNSTNNHTNSTNNHTNSIKRQHGGSQYVGQFHAPVVNTAKLIHHGSPNINQAPMFNPLSHNVKLPSAFTGVVPTGTYYLNHKGGGTSNNGTSNNKSRKHSQWNEFRSANKGSGKSMEELSIEYKNINSKYK